MPAQWIPELFSNAMGGVSSAVSPEMIQPAQVAWAMNCSFRGGKPSTRPALRYRTGLPNGLVQGAGYFGVQQGMGVISIMGRLYRIRANPNNCTWEEITLPWRNSAVLKQVWMCQTVENLVIQDFESDPIIYDGSTARRADSYGLNGDPEVPRGRQMAYGNGRLWVAVNDQEIAAGDIRTKDAGSELKFTEINYLFNGGRLMISNGISGLAFIATNGSTDYGPLVVYGRRSTESIRADITSRDQWGGPGFVTNVLRNTGCASQWSLCAVNQDLYWRDSDGGLRSIYQSAADENGGGSSPISREVSRLTDYDSAQLLEFCSAIYFDNRLLVTSSPRLNEAGGVSWGDLIALNFAPISTMQGKTSPAYEGQWNGIYFTHLFTGRFGGRPRAFAVEHREDGTNHLWEIMAETAGVRDDESIECTPTALQSVANPVKGYIETAKRPFGNPVARKRLERADLYLEEIDGQVDAMVYWRRDNDRKWQLWDSFTVNSKLTTPAGPTPRVPKNLMPQARSQVKTLTIPSDRYGPDGYAFQTGFEFQLRIAWTGRCRIYKAVLHASPLAEAPFARRDLVSASALTDDTTGNELGYLIPLTTSQPDFAIQPPSVTVTNGTGASFVATAEGPGTIIYQWQESTDLGTNWTDVVNGSQYTGVTTPTLRLATTTPGMNGYRYRCAVNNGWSPDGCTGGPGARVYSDAAILTVNMVINPSWSAWTNPAGGNWMSVTYGGGVYVAVGDSSPYIMTSPNGQEWTAHNPGGGAHQFLSVAYRLVAKVPTFVAADHNGKIYYSTDLGLHWTGVVVQTGSLLGAVIAGPDKFVIVGEDAPAFGNSIGYRSVFISSDGITNWTPQRVTDQGGYIHTGIYGGGQYVAADVGCCFTSNDAVNWAVRSIPNRSWTGVAYGSRVYVVVGGNNETTGVANSPDAITWNQQYTPDRTYLVGVAFGFGLFVAVGDGYPGPGVNQTIMTTRDGINWIAGTNPTGTTQWKAVCAGPDKFVAVAYGGGTNNVMTTNP